MKKEAEFQEPWRKPLKVSQPADEYVEVAFDGTVTNDIAARITALEEAVKELRAAVEEIRTNTTFLCWDHDMSSSRRADWERNTGLVTSPSVVHVTKPVGPEIKVPKPQKKGFSLFGKKESSWV